MDNNHLTQKMPATLIYINILKNFLKNIKEALVKRHCFCMHCVRFI